MTEPKRTDRARPHLPSRGTRSMRLAGSLCAAWASLCPGASYAQAPSPAPAAPEAVTPPAPVPVVDAAPSVPSVAVAPAAPAAAPAPVAMVPPAPPAAPPAPPALTPVPPAGPPAGFAPVYTGSFFSRYEARNGFDQIYPNATAANARSRFQDGDAFYYRARFGFNTGLMDVGNDLKVAFQFTPQASGVFGSAPNTITDVNLNLHEGFMRTQGKWVRFDAGRFELNYGDTLVIGNLDWNETGRTFDGFRARIAKSPTSAWLDLFATVVTEGKSQVPVHKVGDGDIYFMGAYAALGPAITKGLDLDLYLLERVWPATDQRLRAVDAATGLPATPAATYQRAGAGETTLGARAKQKLGIFDYRTEVGLQFGTRPGASPNVTAGAISGTQQRAQDVLAYHGDLELGVQAVPDKLRVSAEAMYASGDKLSSTGKNEGWDELYPTAHRFLGLSDAFVRAGIKRTNVVSGVLHVQVNPTKALAFNADGHLFSRPEKLSATGKTGYAGSEIDLGASYTLAKGLKCRALYAVFLPGEDFYPAAPALLGKVSPDPIHFGEVELRYDLAP
jgi:Alginate export